MSFFDRLGEAVESGGRLATVDRTGTTTFDRLLDGANRTASDLLGDHADLEERRVSFMVAPGARWIETLLGIWAAGGVAVPLCLTHPKPELRHSVEASASSVVIGDPAYQDVLTRALAGSDVSLVDSSTLGRRPARDLPDIDLSRRALMLFTSGTTGEPKGVVTTHANIGAQAGALIDAWGWSSGDRILLTLPLHHLHGILNVVLCALWSGATCEMHARFDAIATWDRVASGELSLFMGVPTMYHKLAQVWDGEGRASRRRLTQGAADLRLMVSGSAALPVSMLERWRDVSGHVLLERYGMTELGMVLSNPLVGERRPGFVGNPLPSVDVRLADDDADASPAGRIGEIQVRGPNVFLEYWDDTPATRSAFTDDGWFRTGDLAEIRDGSHRILGRLSVDIIKTGGEKVSALEIENVILDHPDVDECAVVGLDDPVWGERIVAAVVTTSDRASIAADLRGWCKERLAPFKVPKEVVLVESLPRNALGKVVKRSLKALLR